jgi:hypothetical protein
MNHAANLTSQDVINVLLDNRVPPEWVDHSYTHDVLMMYSLYSGSPMQRGLLDDIDNEQLAQLHIYGEPPAIPSWDGWRHPDNSEVQELHDIVAAEESNATWRPEGFNSPNWLLIGQEGTVEYLVHRPQAIASQYTNDHPASLPFYAELDVIPSATAATVTAPTGGNPLVEPATMDVDMATNADGVHLSDAAATSAVALTSLSLEASAPTDTSGDPPDSARSM